MPDNSAGKGRIGLTGQARAVLGSPHFDDESYQVEMEPAPPLLNTILRGVTWTESQLLRWLNLPFGTSIICIARKPNE